MNTKNVNNNTMGEDQNHIIEACIADGLGKSPENEVIEPMTLESYFQICRKFLNGNKILTDDLLKRRLDYIKNDSKLKEHFRPGFKYCPAMIPFSNFGNPLTENELSEGHALRTLAIDPEGKTVNGFSQHPSRIFDRLPVDIKSLAFDVGEYQSKDPYSVTVEEREKIIVNYELAFRMLRRLIEEE